MKKLVTIVLSLLFVAGTVNATPLIHDHFGDNSIDTSIWDVTGNPNETVIAGVTSPQGDCIAMVSGDNIYSKLEVGPGVVGRFILREVRDTRPPYDFYAMGKIGFMKNGGVGYILIRNDNAGGNYLDYSIYHTYGEPVISGHLIGVGGGIAHDIDIVISWASNSLSITATDMASSYTNTFTTTDPNLIPQMAMSAYSGGSTCYDDYTWNTDLINVVPEPATIALLGLGLLALRRRRA